jgi:plasmid stabilization system protein ParE
VHWSEKVKSEFIEKFDRSIEIIRAQPEIFPVSKKGKLLRKCVVSKQTIIYYRFNTKQIDIVTIFDTRQNPEKLKMDL